MDVQPANPVGDLINGNLPVNSEIIELHKYYFLRKQYYRFRGEQWEIPFIIDRVVIITMINDRWIDCETLFKRQIKRKFDIDILKELGLVYENDAIPDGVHKLENEVDQFRDQAKSFREFMEIFNESREAFRAWPHLEHALADDGSLLFEDWIPQPDDEDPGLRIMKDSIVLQFTNISSRSRLS